VCLAHSSIGYSLAHCTALHSTVQPCNAPYSSVLIQGHRHTEALIDPMRSPLSPSPSLSLSLRIRLTIAIAIPSDDVVTVDMYDLSASDAPHSVFSAPDAPHSVLRTHTHRGPGYWIQGSRSTSLSAVHSQQNTHTRSA
jgi:uncharacterized lipoprotein YbaY